MNWEAISAVSEVIAAIAVVASLIYLAIQIRHNTKEIEEQNRAHELGTLSDLAGRFTNFRSYIIENEKTALVWQKGRDDLDSLTPEERFQFDYLACELFWGFAMLDLYHGIGGIDKSTMELTRDNISRHALTPGLKQWWNESELKNDYPENFIKFINDMYDNRLSD